MPVKFLEIEMLIHELSCDLVAITETWLNSKIMSTEFCPKGYDCIRKDRSDMIKGGGILLMYSSKLRVIHRLDLEKKLILDEVNDEILVCQVFHNTHKSFLVILAYRKPGPMQRNFVSNILNILEDIHEQDSYKLFLMGDLNLPTVDWAAMSAPGNTVLNDFMMILNSFNLVQCNTIPSRRGNLNILDVLITNYQNCVNNIQPLHGMLTSDHVPLLIQLNLSTRSMGKSV